MAKMMTDPVLGTLMTITNKYEIWNKGGVTTKVRISDNKKKKNAKKKDK